MALALTGLGSAYYHWAPDSARLAVDRLPLAVAIMALLAAVIAERASVTAGMRLLVPLMLLGMASVIVWHLGEQQGRGDLRLYALVHFYPMVAVPLLLVTGEARYTGAGWLGAATVVYGLAKLCELLDGRIFAWGAMVSGHTLKQLGAAAAAYCVVAMLRRRRPARRDVGVSEPANCSSPERWRCRSSKPTRNWPAETSASARPKIPRTSRGRRTFPPSAWPKRVRRSRKASAAPRWARSPPVSGTSSSSPSRAKVCPPWSAGRSWTGRSRPACALCLAFVIEGLLAVPIAGSKGLFLAGAAVHLFTATSMGIVLGTIGQYNYRRFYTEVGEKSAEGFHRLVERGEHLPYARPCNAMSVSQSTGIPRDPQQNRLPG